MRYKVVIGPLKTIAKPETCFCLYEGDSNKIAASILSNATKWIEEENLPLAVYYEEDGVIFH